jgi:predicted transcriptional regulator
MSISETPERVVALSFGLTWGPAVAGAIAATALAFVLDSFGVAIGLALSSASPTWRDTSFALVLLSGLYLVLAALASYGLGGYIAGRMRRRYDPGELPEFQDGMHGLLVWGIATLLAGLIAAVTLPLLLRTPGVAAATPATSSVPGESLIAFELDRLFRGSERRTGGDLSYDRAEAARILLTTSSHSGMDPTDRAYLARLVAADAGTPAPDAERRVDEVAARVKQDISRARSSAVILAFMAGAAALLGAIAAWAAAIAAGRYRDGREPIPYLLDWSIESHSTGTQQSIPHQ